MKPETIPVKPVDFDAIQLQRIRNYNEAQYDNYDAQNCRTDRMVAVVILAFAACSMVAVGIILAVIFFR